MGSEQQADTRSATGASSARKIDCLQPGWEPGGQWERGQHPAPLGGRKWALPQNLRRAQGPGEISGIQLRRDIAGQWERGPSGLYLGSKQWTAPQNAGGT